MSRLRDQVADGWCECGWCCCCCGMIFLRRLPVLRATDALREGGRSQYNYVNDERRKRKTHDENDENETIRIPSIFILRVVAAIWIVLWKYGSSVIGADDVSFIFAEEETPEPRFFVDHHAIFDWIVPSGEQPFVFYFRLVRKIKKGSPH